MTRKIPLFAAPAFALASAIALAAPDPPKPAAPAASAPRATAVLGVWCYDVGRRALAGVEGIEVRRGFVGRAEANEVSFDPRKVQLQKILDALARGKAPATPLKGVETVQEIGDWLVVARAHPAASAPGGEGAVEVKLIPRDLDARQKGALVLKWKAPRGLKLEHPPDRVEYELSALKPEGSESPVEKMEPEDLTAPKPAVFKVDPGVPPGEKRIELEAEIDGKKAVFPVLVYVGPAAAEEAPGAFEPLK